jgi:hypothetical protein
MPDAPTPNLGLTVPTVGGDSGSWGPEVNANWVILDSVLAFAPIVISASGPIVLPTPIPPMTFVKANGGAAGITLTTPPPANFAGRLLGIKKMDATAGVVLIVPPAGNIDGFPNYSLANQFQFILLYSDGINLDIFGNN